MAEAERCLVSMQGKSPTPRAWLRTVDCGVVSEERERVRRQLPLLVVAQLRRGGGAGALSCRLEASEAVAIGRHTTHQESLYQLRLATSRVAKQNDLERVLTLRVCRGCSGRRAGHEAQQAGVAAPWAQTHQESHLGQSGTSCSALAPGV